jgi:hypothetical protein
MRKLFVYAYVYVYVYAYVYVTRSECLLLRYSAIEMRKLFVLKSFIYLLTMNDNLYIHTH